MARDTKIITTDEVKTIALTDANLDTAYIDQYILYSQRKYIREFLGKEFYEEILDEVENSTLTTANSNVLVYIKDALAHYVVYESLTQIRTSINKGGVNVNLSATAEPATDLGYGNVRNDYIMKAENFREEVDYYIKQIREDDSTAYPLYCKDAQQTGGIIFY